ncbi:lipopolysaccharide assembly protein LapA domain-containing protein [Hansschlegelia sp. KR7-227]|uniref:lipopolysaccharide assembly protein LapA domain-containing protein n=1 Tax=Hansschlegelia sp. KR7-227 TaxID=3400914 RepID=UPI003C001985
MTLRRVLAGLIGLPLALLIVLFAVANRQDVTVSFDPFATDAPALSVALPLFAVILISVMGGVVLGGVSAWAKQGKWRKEARRRRVETARLEAETETARREAAVARNMALPAPTSARRAA